MKIDRISKTFLQFFKDRSVPFMRGNAKIISQFILTLFFIGVSIWFIKHEHTELGDVRDVLETADWRWVFVGVGLTLVYILLQGLMYVASFATVESNVSLQDALVLFLKRNFISIFLPAGGISSLAFFTGPIQKKGIKETQIHFASSIYGFVGILSVVLVAIPALVFAIPQGTAGVGEWLALGTIILLLSGVFALYYSIMKKGIVYNRIIKIVPSSEVFMDDFQNNKIDKRNFIFTILISVLIEFVGMAHVYVSMLALNFEPSLLAAVLAYVISVIFLIVSPFLRGLGAIEVSMTYVLLRFEFGNVAAIAITFLYRFFEFWAPLFAGAITFLMKINKLLMRIVPSLLLLALGIINIVSVLTPAISSRLTRIKDFLPVEAIHTSNYLVMVSGLFLLVTAAFMLKGLRSAWWFAMALSILSCIGHLTKAIDFEEAIAAGIVILILIATRKEYYIKNNPKLRMIGLQTSLLSIAAVIVYGVIGFYFLNERHFNIDFSLWQSIQYTFQNYFLVGSSDLTATDTFARHFLISIKISGFLSFGFLIYTLVRPYIPETTTTENERIEAGELLKLYGRSAIDYFKVYFDKQLFFSESRKAFIAYRVSGNFAVILENPVAENVEEMRKCISEFDLYCFDSGLRTLYYRVPEKSLNIYSAFNKKQLFLGQEGVVDLTTFSLEGGSKKSLRNGLKKVSELGFKSIFITPPVKDGILQKLKAVSDEWLEDTGRSEIIFSQGRFDWDELKQQTIIIVENTDEKVIAFLNIIPDFVKGEGTYDLIRKTKDAPNGIMDFILVELFNYLKSQNYSKVNLGLAPMSGIDDPHTFPEKSMKYAYDKIKSFAHYKGLRDFKDKFSPTWNNEYIIYSHDYDLLQIPSVLTNVIKP